MGAADRTKINHLSLSCNKSRELRCDTRGLLMVSAGFAPNRRVQRTPPWR